MAQMEGQNNTPEKEGHCPWSPKQFPLKYPHTDLCRFTPSELKMDINSLSDAELKTLVIRMLEEFNEDLNRIKKIQP